MLIWHLSEYHWSKTHCKTHTLTVKLLKWFSNAPKTGRGWTDVICHIWCTTRQSRAILLQCYASSWCKRHTLDTCHRLAVSCDAWRCLTKHCPKPVGSSKRPVLCSDKTDHTVASMLLVCLQASCIFLLLSELRTLEGTSIGLVMFWQKLPSFFLFKMDLWEIIFEISVMSTDVCLHSQGGHMI